VTRVAVKTPGAAMHKCGCRAEYKVTATEVSTDFVTGETCGTLMDRPANKSFLDLRAPPGKRLICPKRVRGDQAVM
jgi:hypothetical protein